MISSFFPYDSEIVIHYLGLWFSPPPLPTLAVSLDDVVLHFYFVLFGSCLHSLLEILRSTACSWLQTDASL